MGSLNASPEEDFLKETCVYNLEEAYDLMKYHLKVAILILIKEDCL